MAYFSNSTDGMIFDEQCSECIQADLDAFCPIAAVQMEFNYIQCKANNGDLQRAMSMLVGDDGKCRMKPFLDKNKPKDEQLELF